MNKIVILGRLTKDPEVRYTPSQKGCALSHWQLTDLF